MEKKLKQKLINYFKNYFGDNLISIVFFGSRVRAEARLTSDYDIFLFTKELPKRPLERQKFVRKAISLKFDQRISIHAKTKKEFESGFPPLYLDLGVDGQILYDSDNYIQKKLLRIQEIIKEAGLYRVKRNGYHAWEWKNQPGPYWSITWDGFYDRTG
ncbi:MAG: nucleotidyltransferase domain-containing protein [bacterium]